MRGSHRKLGRKASHRMAMLRTMVNQLIQHQRIRTTLAKAKEIKPLADKMVTLGKRVSARSCAEAMPESPPSLQELARESRSSQAERGTTDN